MLVAHLTTDWKTLVQQTMMKQKRYDHVQIPKELAEHSYPIPDLPPYYDHVQIPKELAESSYTIPDLPYYRVPGIHYEASFRLVSIYLYDGSRDLLVIYESYEEKVKHDERIWTAPPSYLFQEFQKFVPILEQLFNALSEIK